MNIPDNLSTSSSSAAPAPGSSMNDDMLANAPTIVMGRSSNDTTHASPSHMVIEVPDSPTSSEQELAPAHPPPPVDGTLLSSGTGANDDILVIACGHCDAWNLVETSKDYYYVVFKGRGAIGVYRSLEATDVLCMGVPNALCKRYTTRSAAFDALAHTERTNTIAWL